MQALPAGGTETEFEGHRAMPISISPDVVWVLALIQVLGLVCTWAARACEGSAGQSTCQVLYFLLLAMVGTTAVLAMQISTGLWLASGATLGLMIVGATCTSRRSRPHIFG